MLALRDDWIVSGSPLSPSCIILIAISLTASLLALAVIELSLVIITEMRAIISHRIISKVHVSS